MNDRLHVVKFPQRKTKSLLKQDERTIEYLRQLLLEDLQDGYRRVLHTAIKGFATAPANPQTHKTPRHTPLMSVRNIGKPVIDLTGDDREGA